MLGMFVGYLALGKGFAYFGLPPVFIGEVALVALALVSMRSELALPTGPSAITASILVAGIVDHHVHTRDLRRLGGLRRELPIPFVAAVLAGLSMAGVPPLLARLYAARGVRDPAELDTAAARLLPPLG